MSKQSSPFLKITVTHAVLMFSGKIPWLIEKFNKSFKTPNIFYETIFITFDEIPLYLGLLLLLRKEKALAFFISSSQSSFVFKNWTFIRSILFKMCIWHWYFWSQFWSNIYKEMIEFFHNCFLSIISFSLITILCRSLLFFHLDFLIVSFITF